MGNRRQQKNKGFTLIELLVVISIIGLLSAIVLVSLQNAKVKANNSRISQQIHEYISAMAIYYSDKGHYPLSESDFLNDENIEHNCLGNYGVDSQSCFSGGGMHQYEVNGVEQLALQLVEVMPSYPPVLPYVGGENGGPKSIKGAAYKSFDYGTTALMLWGLDGENEDCGQGGFVINFDGATVCGYNLK